MKLSELALEPLHCSLDLPLGDYYQDLEPAVQIVESGYHGPLDERGVPLVRYPGQGDFHNAITTAQYTLANVSRVLRGDRTRRGRVALLCDALVAAQESTGPAAGLWLQHFDHPKYPWLRAPWASAMAQGNAISALLRGWEILGEEGYRSAAEAGYRGLHGDGFSPPLVREGGEDLWYEEYPAEPPLHVLNGHVYALLGVLDWARVSDDPAAAARWRRAARTVERGVERFDLGYWSSYDLRTREPVDRHYHKNIHIPQLRILASLLGSPALEGVADRWEGYLASRLSRIRLAAAFRLRGLRNRLGS